MYAPIIDHCTTLLKPLTIFCLANSEENCNILWEKSSIAAPKTSIFNAMLLNQRSGRGRSCNTEQANVFAVLPVKVI